MEVLCSAGTASVIIALTDGELNEWQFDTAQREVRVREVTSGGRHEMKRCEGCRHLQTVTGRGLHTVGCCCCLIGSRCYDCLFH